MPRASPRAAPAAAGGPEAAALRAAQVQPAAERTALRERYLNARTVDGARGLRTPGVRWWLKYVVLGRGALPFTRLTSNSPHEEKVEAEQMLMDYVVWLATCRPSGRPISARTIKKYVSQVRSWHRNEFRTELCGDLDFAAVNGLLTGICRLIAQPPRKERWGVRTQELAEAIGRFLSGETASSASWAAALTVAFCGLLRGAEFALQPGEAFDPVKHLTRGDICFETDEAGREFVRLRIRVAKRKPGREKETTLLLGGGGTLLDPVAALKRMLRLDPLTPADAAGQLPRRWAQEGSLAARTPLFRDGKSALTVTAVRDTVKTMMGALGLDPRIFGAHSLRIGGASAGLAAGLSRAALQAAGRWSSDIYTLYARASREAVMGMSTVIGSTPFHDIERGEFVDEELMVTTYDLAGGGAGEGLGGVERELIDDALADEDED